MPDDVKVDPATGLTQAELALKAPEAADDPANPPSEVERAVEEGARREIGEDKPERKIIRSSPADEVRAQIAARFKHKGKEWDGDPNKPSNLYGQHGEDADTLPSGEVIDTDAADAAEARSTETIEKPAPAPQKRKVKVRGQEYEVDEETYHAAAQKGLAGDSYLEDAKRLAQLASENLGKRGAQPAGEHPEGGEATDDDAGSGDGTQQPSQHPEKEAMAKLVQAIQYGDPEEVAQATEAYHAASRKAARMDVDEGLFQSKMQDDLSSAKRQLLTFREKNADLAKDPIATKAITNIAEEIYVEDLLNAGVSPESIPQDPRERATMHRAARVKGVISRSVTDVLEDAKGRFLKWRGGDASPKPEPKSQERVAVDRTERRMALPNQPSRSARPAAAVEQPASGQTRTSAIIAGMRKSRGQLVA